MDIHFVEILTKIEDGEYKEIIQISETLHEENCRNSRLITNQNESSDRWPSSSGRPPLPEG